MKTIVVSEDGEWFEIKNSRIFTISNKQLSQLQEENILIRDLKPTVAVDLPALVAYSDSCRDKVSRTYSDSCRDKVSRKMMEKQWVNQKTS